MPDCLIKQPAGLGDIFFCQKIADTIIDRGYHVWWPVIDEYYACVSEHMKKEGITFCRQSSVFPMKEHFFTGNCKPIRFSSNGDLYFPLQHADVNYPGFSVLKAKYEVVGLSYAGWQKHFKFTRNTDRERSLFYDVLGLREHDEYVFVNSWYGSPPDHVKKEIDIAADYHRVEMDMIEGYTIFDWCSVIEKASQIFCVDTSLFYIVDMLDLAAEKLEAYSRFEPSNYTHIDGLFSKKWEYNE